MQASIIICYTNHQLIKRTISYLDMQDCRNNFEILALDNSMNKFDSAAKALNYGASIATGEILIFMHQDVLCENITDISQLINYCKGYNDLTLLGVAGYDSIDKVVCSNITETEKHIIRYQKIIKEPIEVETIDECVIVMRKKDFDKIKFDEEVCDDWHLYGVDLSYSVKSREGKVFCIPVPICHLSTGNTNISFYRNLKKLGKKYSSILPSINSTCVQIVNKPANFNKLIFRQKYLDFRSYCGKILRKIGLRR